MNDNIEPEDFTRELSALLNKYSAETPSGTPDFILAAFMRNLLREFNEAVSARAEWRGETIWSPPVVGAPEEGNTNG